jgi:hypothetical protein
MMHYKIEGSRVLRCIITNAIVHYLVMTKKYVYVIAVAHICPLDGATRSAMKRDQSFNGKPCLSYTHLRGNRSGVCMDYKQYRECNDRLQFKHLNS